MEKINLSNDSLQRAADEEAWKQLSSCSRFLWSESLLEKYKEKVDWKEISSNGEIRWSIPMLQRFKDRIDWDRLSESICEESLTEECIDTFIDKWNWSYLSDNEDLKLTPAILDKYIDYWDWSRIVERWWENSFKNIAIEFYERYKKHIPTDILLDTGLWKAIVDQRRKQIIAEITAQV